MVEYIKEDGSLSDPVRFDITYIGCTEKNTKGNVPNVFLPEDTLCKDLDKQMCRDSKSCYYNGTYDECRKRDYQSQISKFCSEINDKTTCNNINQCIYDETGREGYKCQSKNCEKLPFDVCNTDSNCSLIRDSNDKETFIRCDEKTFAKELIDYVPNMQVINYDELTEKELQRIARLQEPDKQKNYNCYLLDKTPTNINANKQVYSPHLEDTTNSNNFKTYQFKKDLYDQDNPEKRTYTSLGKGVANFNGGAQDLNDPSFIIDGKGGAILGRENVRNTYTTSYCNKTKTECQELCDNIPLCKGYSFAQVHSEDNPWANCGKQSSCVLHSDEYIDDETRKTEPDNPLSSLYNNYQAYKNTKDIKTDDIVKNNRYWSKGSTGVPEDVDNLRSYDVGMHKNHTLVDDVNVCKQLCASRLDCKGFSFEENIELTNKYGDRVKYSYVE